MTLILCTATSTRRRTAAGGGGGPITGPSSFVVAGDTQHDPDTGPLSDVLMGWSAFTTTFNDGSKADHFDLQYKLTGGSVWYDGVPVAPSEVFGSLLSLAENTAYDLRIRAVSQIYPVKDDSSNAFTIRSNNSPSSYVLSSREGPFSTVGSVQFPNTFIVTDNAALRPGAGLFTLEFNIRYDGCSGTDGLVDKAYNSAGGWGVLIDNTAGLSMSVAGVDIFGTVTLPTSTWAHVAIVNDGANVTCYLDGVGAAAVPFSHNLNNASNLTVGGANGYFSGYMTNLRLTNTAVYSGDFTPPAVALTAVAGTKLLVVPGRTTIVDSGPNNYTVTGDIASYDSASPYPSSNGSGSFGDLAGTTSLTVADAAPLRPGSGNLSLDFHLEILSTATISGDIGLITKGFGSGGSMELIATTPNQIQFRNNGNKVVAANITTFDGWQHWRVNRHGSNMCLFRDGLLVASNTSFNATFSSSSDLSVASTGGLIPYRLAGLRFGSASLGNSNFTAPTTPPTATTGTQLLINPPAGEVSQWSTISNHTTWHVFGLTGLSVTADSQNDPGTGPGANATLSWSAQNQTLSTINTQFRTHAGPGSWSNGTAIVGNVNSGDTGVMTEGTSYDLRVQPVLGNSVGPWSTPVSDHTAWYLLVPSLLIFARPESGASLLSGNTIPSTFSDFVWSYADSANQGDWEQYVQGLGLTGNGTTGIGEYYTQSVAAESSPYQQRARVRARLGNSVSDWLDTGYQPPIPVGMSLTVDWLTAAFTIVDSVADLQISQTSSSSGFSSTGSTSGGTLLAGDNWILAAVAWVQNGYSDPYSFAYGTVSDATAGHVLTATPVSPSDLAVTRSGTSVTATWTNADQTNPDGYTLYACDALTGLVLLQAYYNVTSGDTFTDLISAAPKKWTITATNFVGVSSESSQAAET